MREKENKSRNRSVIKITHVTNNIWKIEVSKYCRLKGMKVSITKSHSHQQYLNVIRDSISQPLSSLGKK